MMATNPSRTPDLSVLRLDERARSKKSSRRIVWLSGLILSALAVYAAVFAMKKQQVPEIMLAVAHKAGKEAAPELLNASGYVTPRRRATIASKITGLVTHVFAEEGVRVSEGQTLAALDGSDARLRMLSAQADRDAAAAALGDLEVNLANAKKDAHRAEELYKDGIGSQQSLDQNRTAVASLQARIELVRQQVDAAEARVNVARQDLENTIVRAPFDGLVVSKDAQVGEMISPVSAGSGFTRTGIATLVDMKSLEIEVDVNEAYISRVQPGQTVFAVLDAYPDWKIPARVRIVIPSADRQKATVKVRISFDQLDPRILPDMGVKVTFLGDPAKKERTLADALLIPREAIVDQDGKQIVYKYVDGRVERCAVTVGASRGDEEEIVAGLREGDQVATNGLSQLHNDADVKVKQ
jgi:RND family efflux transporter MFP subunit